jgi:hypothetical protein
MNGPDSGDENSRSEAKPPASAIPEASYHLLSWFISLCCDDTGTPSSTESIDVPSRLDLL